MSFMFQRLTVKNLSGFVEVGLFEPRRSQIAHDTMNVEIMPVVAGSGIDDPAEGKIGDGAVFAMAKRLGMHQVRAASRVRFEKALEEAYEAC
jgi:hypothetical protein